MRYYLVGGAIRDELLGLPVREKDWCVVGATPEDMASMGFQPVGKHFPVFLHPETGEEYALARTEKKTAAGYHGFEFHTSPSVTIEQDLGRRDLTINALARGDDGGLVDPFGGVEDIERRQLRHVSDAFSEDPVRVLRAAKFAARLHAMGFRVAPETMDLMKSMVDGDEVAALVPERVWKETEQALQSDHPQVFFEVLRECKALAVVFPEIDSLFGVPQPANWHPEIDTGIHTMMVLEQAARLTEEPATRFAALVHDLGKATTDPEYWPAHHGHEVHSVRLVRAMAQRLRIPTAFRDLGILVAEFHGHCHRAFELKPATILKVLTRADAFRRPERFEQFLIACEADSRGRTGFENRDYPQAKFLRGALDAAKIVDAADIARQQSDGEDIRKALRAARIRAIGAYKRDFVQSLSV